MCIRRLTFAMLLICTLHVGSVRAQTTDDKTPPDKALILKLQEITFDLQLDNARLQEEIARLRKQLLDVAKDRTAPAILKEWNAKPGETIDWERMLKRPAPENKDDKPAAQTPVETKRP